MQIIQSHERKIKEGKKLNSGKIRGSQILNSHLTCNFMGSLVFSQKILENNLSDLYIVL